MSVHLSIVSEASCYSRRPLVHQANILIVQTLREGKPKNIDPITAAALELGNTHFAVGPRVATARDGGGLLDGYNQQLWGSLNPMRRIKIQYMLTTRYHTAAVHPHHDRK